MLITEKPIQELIEEHRASLKTPYYLIDETRLRQNLEKIALLRARSGVKSVLALIGLCQSAQAQAEPRAQ